MSEVPPVIAKLRTTCDAPFESRGAGGSSGRADPSTGLCAASAVSERMRATTRHLGQVTGKFPEPRRRCCRPLMPAQKNAGGAGRSDPVKHRVAVANQLRAHLRIYYQAPVGLFHELDGKMSLKFLTRFDCQERLDRLTPKRLEAFLAGIRYSGSTTTQAMFDRISAAPRGATGDHGAAALHVTRPLLRTCSPACRAPARCAPLGCWPRSATHADASRLRRPWRRWPASRRRPANPGAAQWSGSAGGRPTAA